jgi:endonuclease/exonuclease/phosphatase family metal-dependent hydrolase
MDLTGCYRIVYLNVKEYISYSEAHGSSSKIDHMLVYEANLNKYRNTEIILCILSDHYAIKLKIKSKQNSSKCANM